MINKNKTSNINITDMSDDMQDRIMSLQYSTYCSGSIITDRYNESSNIYYSVKLQDAEAQRFIPTSKCLKSVTVKVSKILNNDMWVEIRKDFGGLPSGYPKDPGALASSVIPYTETTYTFDANVILTDSDLLNGLWIVVCSRYYDPNYTGSEIFFNAIGGLTGTSNEYEAWKTGNEPWIKSRPSPYNNLYFITKKQTYSVPCPTPAITMTIP